jgi:isocitrate dehydrogenase (NAD+)
MHRVTLIEGDGIGPEVVVAARSVIEAAGADIQWESVAVGVTAKESFGEALPTVAWSP